MLVTVLLSEVRWSEEGARRKLPALTAASFHPITEEVGMTKCSKVEGKLSINDIFLA